ncbi:MAG TPA: indolepyruvate ferredoxin oxidoreductase subunit alpha [Alphaproteobacteria bacterium]|jgi:indolepyruvate ferredoxin oxidoreductase alpha subunit|nr:indolepyruvate ferredoxin oxidoreductase subunit alpha [Alphaproteobacteria bacterium]MDP7429078.1 indolepyruvate ferredoxin oxidoreductase subunit alpha [Alphaproteobacteria bacterium]HJM48415.1 indolepyruvate ferredoxin oxidoreductase subunit alpha [Alphaproteobacteria bacterium]
MERSFKKEVELLRLGANSTFHGEGILAVTKALLQSGVSYVGGYQGAPISHLMDVLADAQDILDELGIHFEASANEAGAAALLGASINYPLRGAVTWKSVVGTNVASDALSNLSSAGVKGGALIIIGEDYGEGASIIQERSHAFAMKSQIWLLDPRPELATIVKMVERGFELSEASNTPVMLELRIRACHVWGQFQCQSNRAPEFSRKQVLEKPDFDFGRICLPPSTYAQEKHKVEVRLPAALDFIRRHELNEVFDGDGQDVGIIVQGGHYNAVARGLAQLGLADAFGQARLPVYVLNVTYPLVAEEFTAFCRDKKAVLVIEEGQPDFIEQAANVFLRKAGLEARVFGKDVLPMAGEYTAEVVLAGLAEFIAASRPAGIEVTEVAARAQALLAHKNRAAEILGQPVPLRPPGFCVGCPERPVFSAMKILEKETGPVHLSSDIGCHTFSTLPPFNMGNTVLGYGLGLAASGGVAPAFGKRVISAMGDGGFWHNGLTSGIAKAVFNRDDSVLLIFQNGYTSATGAQYIPSSGKNARDEPSGMDIPSALRGVGVKWLRQVRTYDVAAMVRTLRQAMTTSDPGLKVIVADGECMLALQRRKKPADRARLEAGRRLVRERFGIDDTVCTGDHSCIRLSGCPSLTIKPSSDPLRPDPVASVDQGCVGCGLCGEVAHAAILCPSFYRAEIVQNPNLWDRFVAALRGRLIGWLARPGGAPA